MEWSSGRHLLCMLLVFLIKVQQEYKQQKKTFNIMIYKKITSSGAGGVSTHKAPPLDPSLDINGIRASSVNFYSTIQLWISALVYLLIVFSSVFILFCTLALNYLLFFQCFSLFSPCRIGENVCRSYMVLIISHHSSNNHQTVDSQSFLWHYD